MEGDNRFLITEIQNLGKIQNNSLYIKRDDLLPISFGGNKARKAIKFFQEIDAGEYDCVVTYGSSSSNHCRIVANMATMRKMPCYIIEPQEASEPTFNSKMMSWFGVKITVVPVALVHTTIEKILEELKKQGRKPYFIAGGGHGNLGTQAYVDCYEEIQVFEKHTHIHFDYIFLASGTGTTQAGLICGQLMHGDKKTIVGISIARKNPRGRQIVLNSVKDYLIEKNYSVEDKQIERATFFEDKYTGNGYGKDSLKVQQSIKEFFFDYGVPLDGTYTGKAYTGMKSYISEYGIQGKNILFIHTGGTPLFFDELEKLNI